MFKRRNNDKYIKAALTGLLEMQKVTNQNITELQNKIAELEEENAEFKLSDELCDLQEQYGVEFDYVETWVSRVIFYCNGVEILMEDNFVDALKFVEDNRDEIETKIKAILFDENEKSKNDKKKK